MSTPGAGAAASGVLAVPLTVALSGACERFERTRRIAEMLGDST